MSDYTLPPHVALVFGAQRSGKTSFAFRYLLNVQSVCNFIFDDRGQAQLRLKLRPAFTAAEVEAALASGWVCFNPARMFPDNPRAAFAWFCSWVLEASRRGPGKKVFFVDECWQFLDSRSVPAELESIVRTGRAENLGLVMAGHRPSQFHKNVRALVTEWVCFNSVDPYDLEAVRPYWSGVDRLPALPKGQFIAVDRETGRVLHGRLW